MPRSVLRAAVFTAIESVGMFAVSGVYLWNVLRGSPQDRAIALLGAGLGLGLAAVLGVLARGLARGRRPALSPVVLIQLLMLPVGWGLLQGRQYLSAALVLGLAVAVLGSLFGSAQSRESFR